MKRFGIALLIFVMMGLLVACGNNAAANNGTGAETAAPSISGDSTAGEQAFIGSCSSCHGIDALGLPGLGKDLTTSTFVAGMDEEQFMEFVKTGRSTSDPANTTGVDMPPKGGNPALSDEDIINIRAFIFSLK